MHRRKVHSRIKHCGTRCERKIINMATLTVTPIHSNNLSLITFQEQHDTQGLSPEFNDDFTSLVPVGLRSRTNSPCVARCGVPIFLFQVDLSKT